VGDAQHESTSSIGGKSGQRIEISLPAREMPFIVNALAANERANHYAGSIDSSILGEQKVK